MGSLFYLYSFLFIVARTTAVVIQAAAIHDESRQLAPELFLCPAECYCIEVSRNKTHSLVFCAFIILKHN